MNKILLMFIFLSYFNSLGQNLEFSSQIYLKEKCDNSDQDGFVIKSTFKNTSDKNIYFYQSSDTESNFKIEIFNTIGKKQKYLPSEDNIVWSQSPCWRSVTKISPKMQTLSNKLVTESMKSSKISTTYLSCLSGVWVVIPAKSTYEQYYIIGGSFYKRILEKKEEFEVVISLNSSKQKFKFECPAKEVIQIVPSKTKNFEYINAKSYLKKYILSYSSLPKEYFKANTDK